MSVAICFSPQQQTGIWRGGAGGTWKQLHGGLPDGDNPRRISPAMAPSRPDTGYALVANRLGSEVLGVYRSSNGGERWQEVGGAHFSAEGQSCYNNTIAVHPDDPDTVACGLYDIHITRDGGAACVGIASRNQELDAQREQRD